MTTSDGDHTPAPSTGDASSGDDAGQSGVGAEPGVGAELGVGAESGREPAETSSEEASSPAGPTADPERGLRGVMSAILILEAVAVLLGLTVIQHGGEDASMVAIVVICAIAAAHVATCAVIARPFAVPVIVVLQAALIACWAISASVGVMGIVFAIVWGLVLYMRREFRRRLAAWHNS